MPSEHADLTAQLGAGLLSFPVTHFAADLQFDEAPYREHVDHLASFDVAALFAAGGTGEFFSLTPAEVARIVRVAIETADGRTPIVAPAGGPTAVATAMARDAEAAGADAILLFPPYLTEATADGLFEHARAICAATDLGVVYYNRSNAVLDDVTLARLAEACPNLVALKDGTGSVELMTKTFARLGDRVTYIGGLPTSELFALPYLELGLTTYSSAIFNFVPEFALEFYDQVRARRRDDVYEALRRFVIPYVEIRDRHAATAVSIIKAGMTAVGRPAGPVRPPLVDLSASDLDDLTRLIDGSGVR